MCQYQPNSSFSAVFKGSDLKLVRKTPTFKARTRNSKWKQCKRLKKMGRAACKIANVHSKRTRNTSGFLHWRPKRQQKVSVSTFFLESSCTCWSFSTFKTRQWTFNIVAKPCMQCLFVDCWFYCFFSLSLFICALSIVGFCYCPDAGSNVPKGGEI